MTSEVLSKETKFTPGPWVRIPPQPELDEDDNETGAFVYPGGIEGADGNPVCTFGDASGSGTMFENQANPDLIAAAPCLFSALDSLLNCVDGVHDYDQLHRCKRNALAALNRARGGSSNEGE